MNESFIVQLNEELRGNGALSSDSAHQAVALIEHLSLKVKELEVTIQELDGAVAAPHPCFVKESDSEGEFKTEKLIHTGNNFTEMLNFCGKSANFSKWFSNDNEFVECCKKDGEF